jgi:hypothetical protein
MRFKGYEAKKASVSTGASTQKGWCSPSEVCIIYTSQSRFVAYGPRRLFYAVEFSAHYQIRLALSEELPCPCGNKQD